MAPATNSSRTTTRTTCSTTRTTSDGPSVSARTAHSGCADHAHYLARLVAAHHTVGCCCGPFVINPGHACNVDKAVPADPVIALPFSIRIIIKSKWGSQATGVKSDVYQDGKSAGLEDIQPHGFEQALRRGVSPRRTSHALSSAK